VGGAAPHLPPAGAPSTPVIFLKCGSRATSFGLRRRVAGCLARLKRALERPGDRQAKAKGPMGEESPSTQHQRITGHCLALDPQSPDRVSSSPRCASGHRRIALSALRPRPMPSCSPALVVAAAAPLPAGAPCRASLPGSSAPPTGAVPIYVSGSVQ
jgi:hypothetical protein